MPSPAIYVNPALDDLSTGYRHVCSTGCQHCSNCGFPLGSVRVDVGHGWMHPKCAEDIKARESNNG